MWRWTSTISLTDKAPTSVIDTGCEISGRIRFVGTLVLNGKVEGELVSADTLLVGEKGDVEAEIQVGTAIVSGQIKGNITARERVELRGSARIFGDIRSPVLILEEGVTLDGRCQMTSGEVAEAERAKKREGLRAVQDDAAKHRSYG